MTKSKIPTIIALLVLLIGVVSVIFIMKGSILIKTGAESDSAPQDLKITNVKDTSFTVSFVTSKPVSVVLKSGNIDGQVNQDTSIQKNHYILINSLHPATLYSFTINSNGSDFDDNGQPWQVTTSQSRGAIDSLVISGKILDPAGFPAKDALVYIDSGNLPQRATKVSQSGNWLISIPPLPENTILNILVENGTNQISSAKVLLNASNPIPTITLGNSYDFTSSTPSTGEDIPKSPILFQ